MGTNKLKKPSSDCCSRLIHISVVTCCFLTAITGTAYFALDPLLRAIILKELAISNNSQSFLLWKNPPTDRYLKVFFFNITNPGDVFNGTSKPKLQEIGPFTYHQKWMKQNITWHQDGTMSYKTRKVFRFVEALSCQGCSETGDKITTLNVPVLSAYQQLRNSHWIYQAPIKDYLIKNNITQWIKKSPFELIWGYDEPLLPWARYLAEIPPHDQFGYFATKNSSLNHNLPFYTMNTGIEDPYNVSSISLYNGNSHLGIWKTDECNEVKGSDGSSFNPFMKKDDTQWLFYDQLCRSIPLIFYKEISQQGLKGLRWKPRKDVFASAKKYPSNDCYKELGRVTGEGIFDISACKFKTRIIMSWPHFMDADDKYREAVEGLQPNHTKHGFWFDIEPITGTTMSSKTRLQINLAVEKLEAFDHLSKVEDIVFPILWFEDGMNELGEDTVNRLKNEVITPEMYKEYILYFLIGLGSAEAILFILAFINVCIHYFRHTIHSMKAPVKGEDDQLRPILHPMSNLEPAALLVT